MVSILFYKMQVFHFDFAARNNEADCCLTGAPPALFVRDSYRCQWMKHCFKPYKWRRNFTSGWLQNGNLDFATTSVTTEILGLTPLAGCHCSGRYVLPSTRRIAHTANRSSMRLWVESLSIKEMKSWTRCRQKTFRSASDHMSVST